VLGNNGNPDTEKAPIWHRFRTDVEQHFAIRPPPRAIFLRHRRSKGGGRSSPVGLRVQHRDAMPWRKRKDPIMRAIARTIALLSILAASGPAQAEGAIAGVSHLSPAAPGRSQPLSVTVWYPATAGGTAVAVGANGVFRGAKGRKGAPIAAGRHPLVLISAGGMRSAPDIAGWLGRALAERGFVVADVHAVRLGPKQARQAPAEIWKRPADLSAALTALEQAPVFAAHLATDRVGAVGFFLGGNAVLSLAGARLDAGKYAASCDAGGAGVDCGWFAKGGVDLHKVDPAKIGAGHEDARVKIAVAVDPELADSYAGASLAGLKPPVIVLGLGHPVRLAGASAGAAIRYRTVETASRFSAFSRCKPKGAAILAASGAEAAICTSDDGPGRARVHAEIARRIGDLLAARFKKDR
jgi:predicted dienelactone hydrolase